MDHHYSGLRSPFSALIAAAAFVFLLNIPSLVAAVRDYPTIVRMGDSLDEQFYSSLIADVADGHWVSGNVALREHREWKNLQEMAPVLQGAAIRFFCWNIRTAVLAGDIVFPFLTVFLLALAFTHVFGSRATGACAAFLGATAIGAGFLRTISPQVTLLLVACHLYLFLARPRQPATLMLRGALIALLLFVHIVTAPFLVAVEGIDALLSVRREHWKGSSLSVLSVALLPCLAFAAQWIAQSSIAPGVLADWHRRLGMIVSHLPAAPLLQLQIAVTLLALWWTVRVRDVAACGARSIAVLLGALLLALNQSVVHGVDITFGLYYARPAMLLLPVAWLFMIMHVVDRRWCAHMAAVAVLAAAATFLFQIDGQLTLQAAQASAWDGTTDAVLDSLRAVPEERVILAPLAIADLIPVFTSHDVAFNRFATFTPVSDAELADRHLLEEAFFPTPTALRDRNYTSVLGIYAGNMAARDRTLHHPLCLLRPQDAACAADVRRFVYHQELLPILDRGKGDPVPLLRKFHVDLIVTDRPLPPGVGFICGERMRLGRYGIYECQRT